MSRRNSIDTRPIDFHTTRTIFENPDKKQKFVAKRTHVSQRKKAIIPPSNSSSKKDIQPPITSHRVASEKSPPPPPRITSGKPPPLPPKLTQKVAPKPEPKVIHTEAVNFIPKEKSSPSFLKKVLRKFMPHFKSKNKTKNLSEIFPNPVIFPPRKMPHAHQSLQPTHQKASLPLTPTPLNNRVPVPPTRNESIHSQKKNAGVAKLFQDYQSVIRKGLLEIENNPEKNLSTEEILKKMVAEKNKPIDISNYGFKNKLNIHPEDLIYQYLTTYKDCLSILRKSNIKISYATLQFFAKDISRITKEHAEALLKKAKEENRDISAVMATIDINPSITKERLRLKLKETVRKNNMDKVKEVVYDACDEIIEKLKQYELKTHIRMAKDGEDLNLLNFSLYDPIDLPPTTPVRFEDKGDVKGKTQDINLARLLMEEFPEFPSLLQKEDSDYKQLHTDMFNEEERLIRLTGDPEGKTIINFNKKYYISDNDDSIDSLSHLIYGYISVCYNLQIAFTQRISQYNWKDAIDEEKINEIAHTMLSAGIVFTKKIVEETLKERGKPYSPYISDEDRLAVDLAIQDKLPALVKGFTINRGFNDKEDNVTLQLEKMFLQKNKDKALDKNNISDIATAIRGELEQYVCETLRSAINNKTNFELLNLAPFDHNFPPEKLLSSSQREKDLLSKKEAKLLHYISRYYPNTMNKSDLK